MRVATSSGSPIHVGHVMLVWKMDTPTGLFTGTCTCGWESDALKSRMPALRTAEAHAGAKNSQESTGQLPPPRAPVRGPVDPRPVRAHLARPRLDRGR